MLFLKLKLWIVITSNDLTSSRFLFQEDTFFQPKVVTKLISTFWEHILVPLIFMSIYTYISWSFGHTINIRREVSCAVKGVKYYVDHIDPCCQCQCGKQIRSVFKLQFYCPWLGLVSNLFLHNLNTNYHQLFHVTSHVSTSMYMCW